MKSVRTDDDCKCSQKAVKRLIEHYYYKLLFYSFDRNDIAITYTDCMLSECRHVLKNTLLLELAIALLKY